MIKKWFINEKNILLASLCIGLVITFCFAMATKTYSENIQGGIANEVVRFHVLANSDEDYDQQLKLKVRDAILNEFKEELDYSNSKIETLQLLNCNMSNIIECAKKVVRENGYDYDVTACISKDFFPTKVYGDVSLPAGEYDALRILIGKGEGKNWWCVMFPPLCFVDVTHNTTSTDVKEELKNILTDEEFSIVTKSNSNNIPVKIKFKLIEWWNSKNLA